MKTIRAWRQDLGLTQFELAVKVGVRPQTVYFWESGRRTPRVAYVRKLGQIFGVNSDEIDLDAALATLSASFQAPHPSPSHQEIPSHELVARAGSLGRASPVYLVGLPPQRTRALHPPVPPFRDP